MNTECYFQILLKQFYHIHQGGHNWHISCLPDLHKSIHKHMCPYSTFAATKKRENGISVQLNHYNNTDSMPRVKIYFIVLAVTS